MLTISIKTFIICTLLIVSAITVIQYYFIKRHIDSSNKSKDVSIPTKMFETNTIEPWELEQTLTQPDTTIVRETHKSVYQQSRFHKDYRLNQNPILSSRELHVYNHLSGHCKNQYIKALYDLTIEYKKPISVGLRCFDDYRVSGFMFILIKFMHYYRLDGYTIHEAISRTNETFINFRWPNGKRRNFMAYAIAQFLINDDPAYKHQNYSVVIKAANALYDFVNMKNNHA